MRPLLLLPALAILFLALLWVFQRRLIYLPIDRHVPPVGQVLPAAEEVRFRTADDLELNGWHLPAADGGEAWGVVLVFNGNAGHRGYRAPLAEALARAGLAVLLVDYRGYGENSGWPTEAGLRLDADAAAAFLVRDRGYAPERLVYFGESLGAAVAVDLATRRPPAALVLRSPFSSLADIGRVHYPFLPVRVLLRDRFESIDRIHDVGAPLLVVAGERDSIVPVRSSRALFDAASEPKRWVEIPGADHNDLELLAGRRMLAEIVAFLRENLRAGGEARVP
ncbi:MAG TPA: alpha/beta hydrolase [Thermoanaerobaculia bacterium]|nr:alpha/beta hydrolase [Thermoanaerobaculia bacterium]